MNKAFDLKNIYSKQNAKILEDLLDEKIIAFAELIKIFDLDVLDTDYYLIDLISPWEWPQAINNYLSLELPIYYFTAEYCYYFFCWILQQYYIPNLGETAPLEVYADKVLSLLITKGILPAEIVQLPRRNKEKIDFDIIDDYYENNLSYTSTTIKEIIYHPRNYSHSSPLTLTYYEALARIEARGFPKSLLECHATQLKLNVYLGVGEGSIIDDSQVRNLSAQSVDFFRDYNCGNPIYIKRYKGLEALEPNQVLRLYEGNTIKIQDNELFHRRLEVQSTDLEKKYHLQRLITSCIQIESDGGKIKSNKFQLKDTLYLSDDVDSLILVAKQSTQPSNDKIYNIQFSLGEIAILKEKLQKDPKNTSRIRDQVQHYKNLLQKMHPNRTIEKAKVIKMLHLLEQPIYFELGLNQPKDYARYTRN